MTLPLGTRTRSSVSGLCILDFVEDAGCGHPGSEVVSTAVLWDVHKSLDRLDKDLEIKTSLQYPPSPCGPHDPEEANRSRRTNPLASQSSPCGPYDPGESRRSRGPSPLVSRSFVGNVDTRRFGGRFDWRSERCRGDGNPGLHIRDKSKKV